MGETIETIKIGNSPLRAVFDSNIVISALIFGGQLGWLSAAWSSGRVTAVVSEPTVAELQRVLTYPKFRLDDARRQRVMLAYLSHAEHRSPPPLIPDWAEACRDKSDAIFLALASSADVPLVTGDRVIAALAVLVPITVVSPHALQLGLQP